MFVGLEIEFRDGGTERIPIRKAVPAGHLTPPFQIDADRAIRAVSIELQPGLRPGTTAIQLLGKVEHRKTP